MSVKKRIVSFLLVLLVVLAIGGELLLSLFAVKADAAEGTSTTYSNVLDDLKKDSNFYEELYPADRLSSDIHLIHIAEGQDGDLFVYTYQPGNENVHRKANFMNMSFLKTNCQQEN